uniref:Uncharacterized protein n=1 Tax=Picea sitchensis TaxID=3332 RepID=A9NSN5_PICSI|nr:unknown [Picea sitchensis]
MAKVQLVIPSLGAGPLTLVTVLPLLQPLVNCNKSR